MVLGRKKKPYRELTLEKKVELIELARESPSTSQATIANRYRIAKSNVCRILQRKDEYLQAWNSAIFARSRKRRVLGTGNETLRAHMYKQHQISRMFMCRCCNWAFPDKTSLHMHMQAKEEGKTINVPIIGKGGAGNSLGGPIPMAQVSSQMVLGSLGQVAQQQQQQHIMAGMGSNGVSHSSNIFPSLAMVPQRADDLMTKLRERFIINTMMAQSGIHLAAWLANFPKVDASGVGSLGGSLDLRPMNLDETRPIINEIKLEEQENGEMSSNEGESAENLIMVEEIEPISVDDDVDAAAGDDDDQNYQFPENGQSQTSETNDVLHMPALRSAISASPLNSILYKKRLDTALRRKNIDNVLMNLTGQATAHTHQNGNSPSETVSSSSTASSTATTSTATKIAATTTVCTNSSSGTENDGSATSDERPSSESPPNDNHHCFYHDCSLLRGKLAVANNRCRYLEGRTAALHTDALRLSARVSGSESNARHFEREGHMLREQNETLQRKLLECQEKTLTFLQGDMHGNGKAVSMFLNDILQTTFLG